MDLPASLPYKSLLLFVGLTIVLACESSDDPVDPCLAGTLSVSISSTSNTECGNSNGSIIALGSGGTAPYMFSLDGTNYQESGTFNMLSPGSYTITIRDANNCSSTIESEIIDTSPIQIGVSVQSTDCGTSNGGLTVEATGGTPGYMYSLNSGALQTSNIFEMLSPGNYAITVQDADGCETTSTHRVLSNTSWANDILPIINTRCALPGCHNGQSSLPNWTDLSTVQQNATNIKNRTGARTMPPSGQTQLTDDQIALIACWVDDGAPGN